MATHTIDLWHAGYEQRNALEQAEAEHQKAEKEANDRADALEKRLAAMRGMAQDLNDKLEVEIEKNKTYSDCLLPDDGVRLRNQAARDPARGAR